MSLKRPITAFLTVFYTGSRMVLEKRSQNLYLTNAKLNRDEREAAAISCMTPNTT